jgi:hypothetical protein|tara:strand:+ start:321 stop:881 length:561 start_codon:yes stop_codon:yes gene_type:complete
MFNEYADDEHQKQAEEFIMELGRFVLSFERVCDAMRYIIMFMLRDQGLSNQRMEQVLVGDKAAAELQILLGALFCELPNQDADDKKAVKVLLSDIKSMTEIRNVLLHCSWSLGTSAAADDKELHAATVRYRAKQNSGAGTEVRGYTASYVREQSKELTRIQVLLGRLQYCVVQSGFKVATEFGKSL